MTTSTSTPDVSSGPTLTPLRRPAVTPSRRAQHPQPPRGPRFGVEAGGRQVPVYRARLLPDTDSEDGEQKQERAAAVEKLGRLSVNSNPAPAPRVTEDRRSDDKRHHSLHLVESPVKLASKVSLTSEISEACSKVEAHLKKFDSDSDTDDEDPPWLQLHSSPNRGETVNNESATHNTLVDNALASEYKVGEKIVTSTSMNMDFHDVASLRQVCPGVLGASLVSLLNTGGGAVYLGAGPGGAVRGATLSRADRDRTRQLLDRVLCDHIAPWAGLGKYVDIEFVPVVGGGELWVARVLVKVAPHMRLVRFRHQAGTRQQGRCAHTSD